MILSFLNVLYHLFNLTLLLLYIIMILMILLFMQTLYLLALEIVIFFYANSHLQVDLKRFEHAPFGIFFSTCQA